MRSAMVPILSPWRSANSISSGIRAMDPSGFMISQMTDAGVSPASSGRSQPASVCPARTSTPPFCAMIGKICPGCTMSSGFACFPVATRTVRARSDAEMPVDTPLAASIVTVKLVPRGERLSTTMSGRFSCRHLSSVNVRQTRPRAFVAKKLIASGVTKSAARRRSPSFSRSSASARTTMRPRRMSSMSSWVGLIVMVFAPARPSFCHLCREDSLDIARQHVHLDIHPGSGGEVSKRRRRARVRNHVDLEGRAAHLVDGEAYAVDRDRALAREKAGELRGCLDDEPGAAAQVLEGGHLAHAVDVAAHEVAVEPIGEPHRLLEVHLAPALQSRGNGERGARGIDLGSLSV